MKIKISGSAVKDGDLIPSRYTCDGENISPSLNWSKPDDRIKSFAIIADDPDAPSGDFVHWLVYNIPANVNEFLENVTPTRNIPNGVKMGKNDLGKLATVVLVRPQEHIVIFSKYLGWILTFIS